MKQCKVCGSEIPAGRLKALPNARTCVQHSTAEKFGMNVIQHGDVEDDGFQEFEIIRDPNAIHQLNEYKKQLGTYR